MAEYQGGWRTIGGRRFHLAYTRDTMPSAQKDAVASRKDGFLARIVTRTISLRRAYGPSRKLLVFDVYVCDVRGKSKARSTRRR